MNNTLSASFIDQRDSCNGTFNLKSLLQIDGSFKGKIISTNDVIITAGAVVESAIVARSVVIGGSLKGSIQATERVVLLSGSIIEGSILAPHCEIEKGSLVNADMKIPPTSEISPNAKN